MEKMDSSYLVFEVDAVFYLLTLSCVERIMDADQVTELSFVDFLHTAGGHTDSGNTVHRYCILLKADDIQSTCPDDFCIDREAAGILASRIDGIVESSYLREFLLTEPVINSQNHFLKSVAKIQLADGERWGYMLDAKLLTKAAEMDTPIQAAEEQGTEVWKTPAEEAAQYLILEREGQTVYIDRDKIVAVVMRPQILRVPLASDRVMGISFYEEELVVYYGQSVESDKECLPEGARGFACGIIFRTEQGHLAGMAGDSTGEASAGTGLTDSILPLGDGVWGKRSD